MSNPLSGLKIDHWWHAFTVVGSAGMIACVVGKVDFIPQRQAFLFFLSLFLFGIGQWINHPIQVRLEPGIKITGYHRRSSPLGLALELLGCIFFVVEVYRLAFGK